jgi:hypothetical protein
LSVNARTFTARFTLGDLSGLVDAGGHVFVTKTAPDAGVMIRRLAADHRAGAGEGLNEVTCRYEAFAQRHVPGLDHTQGTWEQPGLKTAHPISSYLFRPHTVM